MFLVGTVKIPETVGQSMRSRLQENTSGWIVRVLLPGIVVTAAGLLFMWSTVINKPAPVLDVVTTSAPEAPAPIGFSRRTMPECDRDPLTDLCKPAFLLIGVQKCGSSTLFQLLHGHPQLCPPGLKELLWWNQNFELLRCPVPEGPETYKAWLKYKGMFPKIVDHSKCMTGEFTVTYLHCWCCPSTFKFLMPKVRLLNILRDPIDRAFSRWTEQKTMGQQQAIKNKTFAQHVDEVLPQLKQCLLIVGPSVDGQVRCANHYNYLGFSIYNSSVALWLEYFDKRDFLLTYSDDLKSAPEKVLYDIEDYLGIEHISYGDKVHNRYNVAGRYAWEKVGNELNSSDVHQESEKGMTTATRAKLMDFYRPFMRSFKGIVDSGLERPWPSSWAERWLQ